MSPVGKIRGSLILRIGGQDCELGEISIPLVAQVKPRRDSGSPEITVGIQANLSQVRDAVEAIFADKETP